MRKDTPHQLSTITVALHWTIGILIITMLPYGLYIEGMERGPEKFAEISLHKSFGVTILALALLRVLWRSANGFPTPLGSAPSWQHHAARAAHIALLLMTVLMPASGILMSVGGGYPVAVFGWELIATSETKRPLLGDIGHTFHAIGGKFFIALILLHVLAAVRHHVQEKDGTLRRMLGKNVS